MTDLSFDHIGVVVPALAEGRAFFAAALPIAAWTAAVDDPGLGVSVQFGRDASGVVYELIAPLGESSPVTAALRSGRHLLNHVAYRTASIAREGARLRELGCVETAAPHPALAYAGATVQFWVSPLRILLELIEAPPHARVPWGVTQRRWGADLQTRDR